MLKVFYNQARVKPLTSSSSSAQDCLSFCSQCLSAVIVWHFQAYINHCVGQALLFCRNSYKTWQGSHQNQVLSPKRIAGFCSQHPQLWQVSEYPQNVSWCKTCALSLFETWKRLFGPVCQNSNLVSQWLNIYPYLFIYLVNTIASPALTVNYSHGARTWYRFEGQSSPNCSAFIWSEVNGMKSVVWWALSCFL